MTSLTPAASRIVDAAIEHCATRGYDGASLNEIAVAVGVRKASIYAHFPSKDALFLEAFERVHLAESGHIRTCFETDTDAGPAGLHYCRDLVSRYADSPCLQFFLRTGYITPQALVDTIDARHEAYLSQLETAFTEAFLTRHGTALPVRKQASRFAEVYLGIVDSVQVKLLYTTPAQAARRLDAMADCLQAAMRDAGLHP